VCCGCGRQSSAAGHLQSDGGFNAGMAWEVDEASNPMVQLGKDSQHISPISPIRVGLEAESL